MCIRDRSLGTRTSPSTMSPEESKHKIMFENLTPLFPKEQFRLERDIKSDENITSRIIDLIAPIGKGQRALLVSAPKSGKTVMMQNLAHALIANYPEVYLIAVSYTHLTLPTS